MTRFYVPITLFAFYEVQVSGISLNGRALSSTSHLGESPFGSRVYVLIAAIIDTGTTDLILPTKVAAAMMAPVNGQLQRDGSYVVPVGSIDTTTQFTVNFSQGSININVLDLIAGYAVSITLSLRPRLISLQDSSRRYYYMNVYASDTQDPNGQLISIMGDVFIKNALTVFSYSQNGAPAVGFQQLNANSAGDTSSVAVAVQTTAGIQPSGTFHVTGTRSGVTVSGTVVSASRAAGRERVGLSGAGVMAGVLAGVACGAALIL
jgi:hypothetical protein